MREETFLLVVIGNGMKNAGILDGNLICCRKSDSAQDGDIVYARIESGAHGRYTLSRYREEGGEVRLYSETDDMNFAPYTSVAPGALKILGIFKNVIKVS